VIFFFAKRFCAQLSKKNISVLCFGVGWRRARENVSLRARRKKKKKFVDNGEFRREGKKNVVKKNWKVLWLEWWTGDRVRKKKSMSVRNGL
jgi:hypothetical protein